jgi:hypothetical protein
LIRKPEGAERASALRRTAETTLEAGEWARSNSHKVRNGCGSLVGWYLAIIFLFGALTASSWGARILGVTIVSIFIYIFRRIGRARRLAD